LIILGLIASGRLGILRSNYPSRRSRPNLPLIMISRVEVNLDIALAKSSIP